MNNCYDSTQIQTIAIGGGQAGLSVGYHLAKRDLPFVILDANLRTGDAWRNRWDSLRLFSPARYSGLPGMRFPAPGSSFPTKEQMADYLVDYATRFGLPVRNGVSVDRLWREGGRFVMSAGNQLFESENVVVAMANYQIPHMPAFARELDPGIVQIHSHAYRKPSQLQEGGVLVVGVGNSGGDIAIEVARTHPTWLSGKGIWTHPLANRNLPRTKLSRAAGEVRGTPRPLGEHAHREKTAAATAAASCSVGPCQTSGPA
jgi:putative flavoprotein involved in K+ transport